MILMANYKIGELSKLLKIPETTIRYYDKMGIIDSQKNEENGYRLFNDVDMHNLMHYKMLFLLLWQCLLKSRCHPLYTRPY